MNDLSIYFDELGIGGASAEVKEDVLLVLGQEIMKQLFIDLRAALSEEAFREVEQAAADGDLSAITLALGRHLPDSGGFIKRSAGKVIADFKEARSAA